MAGDPKEAGPAPGSFPGATWGQTQDCLVCPLGLTFFALRNTRPEVMEHLMKAGMELMLAFKSVLDAASEHFPQSQGADEPLERITID